MSIIILVASLGTTLIKCDNSIIYLCAFILGGSSYYFYITSMVMVCSSVKNTLVTYTNALLLFIYSSGAILSPIMYSLIEKIDYVDSIFSFICIIILAFLITVLYLRYKNNKRSY